MSPSGLAAVPVHAYKPRVFIVSDISNEPDDAESLCRYLLYSNQFQTRGLVACTSTWMRDKVHPEDMEKIVKAYGEVVDNLNAHVPKGMEYSPAQTFLDMIKTGTPVYGMKALEPGVELSSGAKMLIERVDESEEPLWILCWGGTNVIAQALKHVHETEKRGDEDLKKFRSKMRIYAISDQDDTGMVMRRNYPDILYIASVHSFNNYGLATWTGLSGDKFYNFDQGGPDFTTMTKEWIKEHIQIGPLGKAYPDYIFIPEGDTPTFLYLIQNGLSYPEKPNWGSWGGRYDLSNLGDVDGSLHYSDVADRVVGKDGKTYSSPHSTIWRWRDAIQNDFAARIQMTLTSDFSKANHAPVAIVNGSAPGPEPIYITAEAASEITLDASGSYDPDEGQELTFKWIHYRDISASQWWVDAEVQECEFVTVEGEQVEGRKVKVALPYPARCAMDLHTRSAKAKGQELHFILEVKDNGVPAMVSYKRVVVQITNEKLSTEAGPGGNPMEEIFKLITEMQDKAN